MSVFDIQDPGLQGKAKFSRNACFLYLGTPLSAKSSYVATVRIYLLVSHSVLETMSYWSSLNVHNARYHWCRLLEVWLCRNSIDIRLSSADVFLESPWYNHAYILRWSFVPSLTYLAAG